MKKGAICHPHLQLSLKCSCTHTSILYIYCKFFIFCVNVNWFFVRWKKQNVMVLLIRQPAWQRQSIISRIFDKKCVYPFWILKYKDKFFEVSLAWVIRKFVSMLSEFNDGVHFNDFATRFTITSFAPACVIFKTGV